MIIQKGFCTIIQWLSRKDFHFYTFFYDGHIPNLRFETPPARDPPATPLKTTVWHHIYVHIESMYNCLQEPNLWSERCLFSICQYGRTLDQTARWERTRKLDTADPMKFREIYDKRVFNIFSELRKQCLLCMFVIHLCEACVSTQQVENMLVLLLEQTVAQLSLHPEKPC